MKRKYKVEFGVVVEIDDCDDPNFALPDEVIGDIEEAAWQAAVQGETVGETETNGYPFRVIEGLTTSMRLIVDPKSPKSKV